MNDLGVVALTSALAYVLYHYGADAKQLRRWLAPQASVHGQRLLGAVLLGLVPLAVIGLALEGGVAAYGLTAAPLLPTLLIPCGVLLGLSPILWLASGGAAHQERYPQLRAARWDARLVGANGLSWGIYLLGYELFFRGFLLFALVPTLGAWPAVLVMTALYTFAHLPKDFGECLGCVPMGIVFGWLALETGAIWAPFLLHWGIALTSDTMTVVRSPERALVLRPTRPRAWSSSPSSSS